MSLCVSVLNLFVTRERVGPFGGMKEGDAVKKHHRKQEALNIELSFGFSD